MFIYGRVKDVVLAPVPMTLTLTQNQLGQVGRPFPEAW